MKLPLLLAPLLGLGSLLPAQAQQVGQPLASQPRLTHTDSVVVLHQLFGHARRGARMGAIADALVLPSNVVSLASGQGTNIQQGLQTVNVAIFSPMLVGNIVRWIRYSKRREREAVLRFEQQQVQPLYLQRAYALALISRQAGGKH